jgi:hypothetical protein
MKHNYILIALSLSISTATLAQQATSKGTIVTFNKVEALTATSVQSTTGDTIFYWNVQNWMDGRAGVFPGQFFTIDTARNKALMHPSSINAFAGFKKISTTINGVTNQFLAASSYYNVPGIADNYYGFGPLNLPTTAQTFKWKHTYYAKAFRDGYTLKISKTKPTQANGYSPFDSQVLKTFSDNDITTKADTSFNFKKWYEKSVAIPATYLGNPCYFYFHHTANDMDALAIDNIYIQDNSLVSTNTIATTNTPVLYPNPAINTVTLTNLTIGNTIKIYNAIGAIVYTDIAANNECSINISTLNNGTYLLQIGNNVPVKLIVNK